MLLRVQECEFPNGAIYGVFYIGRDEIGRADKVDDGWRLFRARKILPREQAAKAMIDRKISKARDDEEKARKLLATLGTICGGRIPPDGSKPPNT